jgi:hypothetical protein
MVESKEGLKYFDWRKLDDVVLDKCILMMNLRIESITERENGYIFKCYVHKLYEPST